MASLSPFLRFGLLLKMAREARGLTLEETAASIGVQAQTIRRIERGTSMPLFRVHDLAAFFGLQLELGLPSDTLEVPLPPPKRRRRR